MKGINISALIVFILGLIGAILSWTLGWYQGTGVSWAGPFLLWFTLVAIILWVIGLFLNKKKR